MHYPQLSREALQVLELLPGWRLRSASGASAAVEPPSAVDRQAAVLLMPELSEAGRKLWQQIVQAMMGLGYEPAWVENAQEINPKNERAIGELIAAQRPQVLMVFGLALAESVDRLLKSKAGDSAVPTDIRLVSLPGVQDMIETPAFKRQTWQAICSLRQSLP